MQFQLLLFTVFTNFDQKLFRGISDKKLYANVFLIEYVLGILFIHFLLLFILSTIAIWTKGLCIPFLESQIIILINIWKLGTMKAEFRLFIPLEMPRVKRWIISFVFKICIMFSSTKRCPYWLASWNIFKVLIKSQQKAIWWLGGIYLLIEGISQYTLHILICYQ